MNDDKITSEQWADFNDCINGVCVKSMLYPKNSSLRAHWHDRFEFWIVKKGCLEINSNFRTTVVHENDIAVFNPYEAHSALGTEDSEIIYFIIDLKTFGGGPENIIGDSLYSLLTGKTRIKNAIIDDTELQNAILLLSDSAKGLIKNRDSSLKTIGLVLYIIGLMLLRHTDTEKTLKNSSSSDELTDVLSYLYSVYERKVTLNEIAAHAGFSRSYFCRWFKEKTTKSPMDYLSDIRVKKAYELLSVSDLPVTDVCEKTGFSDINSMNIQFKKRLGMTPSDCRRQNRR